MNLSVCGTGRWGAFQAWYHGQRNVITLWGLADSPDYQELLQTGKNEYITMPSSVTLTDDLEKALQNDYIIISISAQHLRSFAQRINTYPVAGKTFILCMKGLEADTGKRLTQVIHESITQPIHLAVWVGPGHVQDFAKGVPNCMVVDSENPAVVDDIVDKLNSDLIRLYKGNDIIGTEIGSAAKNVIGIAAGMLDGRDVASLKGALMARGAREIARLIHAMGGNELSAYGLCHLGDYEATLFSKHSHNRQFGESYIRGEAYGKLAEGVPTSKAMVELGKQYHVDLPICETIYSVLYEKRDAGEALLALFRRSVKGEFYL